MISYNAYLKQDNTKHKVASYLQSQYGQTIKHIGFDVPKRLFKYTRIHEYIISDLENGQFTMSCPTLFNDLYDAAIHRNSIESRYADELEKQELLRLCGFSEVEPIDMDKIKKEAEHEDKFLSQYMKEVFRIGCLSEDNDSILMWSHYADNNRGICIEYDMTNSQIEPFIYPVAYVSTPLDCSVLCETDIDLAMLLSTIVKYDIWSYEKEWRMLLYYPTLKHEKRTERIPVLMPKPRAIYLGRSFLQHWIDRKHKGDLSLFNRLCDYLRTNNIEIYIMKNKIMSFELYPEKIDIDLVQSLNEGKLYDNYLV